MTTTTGPGLAIGFAPPIDASADRRSLPWLAIDIETANARPEEAERAMRLEWNPSPEWKNETIGKRYQEALAKKLERLSLLDSSPIACVSLRCGGLLFACLHAIGSEPRRSVHDGWVAGYDGEAAMLAALAELLAQHVDPTTVLVGHNILAFDLRKLRRAFVRHGLRIPPPFADRNQPVVDTMREYCSRFALRGDQQVMVALDTVLEEFGIASHKSTVSGADVPGLVERREVEILVRYALLDVVKEEDLFLRMTGEPGLTETPR